jgi:hypothetical protein
MVLQFWWVNGPSLCGKRILADGHPKVSNVLRLRISKVLIANKNDLQIRYFKSDDKNISPEGRV